MLFAMRSLSPATCLMARRTLASDLGGDVSDEQVDVLRKATFAVEDSAGTTLLYLHRIGQLGAPAPLARLRAYDAYVPGGVVPVFTLTNPDVNDPNRKPHMYVTLPGEPTNGENVANGPEIQETQSTRFKLINFELDGRWAMHELSTKRWVAQAWPVQSVMVSRIPFVGKDALTMRAAPQVDLLLLASIAFTKLEADAEIRDNLRILASSTNIGLISM